MTARMDAFINSKLIQAGVIRNLEIIGEAAKRASSDFRVFQNSMEKDEWTSRCVDS